MYIYICTCNVHALYMYVYINISGYKCLTNSVQHTVYFICLHVQVFEEKDKNFLSEFVLKPFQAKVGVEQDS